MSDNADIIRRAFALQNAHQAEELAAMYAENAVFNDVPLGAFLDSRDGMKKLWKDTWATFSQFRMEPGFIVANERGGAADFVMSGLHIGDFPGYPASGKSFSLKGASVIRIEKGKIVEWSDYWSTGDMDRQIGVDQ